MLVVDASVLATALGDDGADGQFARRRLAGRTLAAPELIYLEVLSVWRRQLATGDLTPKRALEAMADLADLPITVAQHLPLLARCWELRDNATVYDAAYVALAEVLGVPLLTADGRLGRAPGVRCAVDVLAP
ncbi:MAG: type II toxin-antitoxin system VapC family toxin [Candidatus Nanopelagicales bacterium]|nr:type II toxin-antitoxin system VapC family toxin [Candidatus Nanopelagicales bacterium]